MSLASLSKPYTLRPPLKETAGRSLPPVERRREPAEVLVQRAPRRRCVLAAAAGGLHPVAVEHDADWGAMAGGGGRGGRPLSLAARGEGEGLLLLGPHLAPPWLPGPNLCKPRGPEAAPLAPPPWLPAPHTPTATSTSPKPATLNPQAAPPLPPWLPLNSWSYSLATAAWASSRLWPALYCPSSPRAMPGGGMRRGEGAWASRRLLPALAHPTSCCSGGGPREEGRGRRAAGGGPRVRRTGREDVLAVSPH